MLSLFGEERVFQFIGAYQHHICLTLFPKKPHPAGHVVILAIYQNQLLFTRHQHRGLEWPGGKIEQGETPIQAAIRELHEETGGLASSLWFIGQYEVVPASDVSYTDKNSLPFIKNIYVAQVDRLDQQHTGTDTLGPALFPLDVSPSLDQGFSPLVLDPVFDHVRQATVINPESGS